MKFSAAVTVGLAPLAIAKSVRNTYPGRRDAAIAARKNGENRDGNRNSFGSNSISIGDVQNLGFNEGVFLGQILGQSQVTLLEQVILVWVNPGNNAATTVINQLPGATVAPVAGAPPPAGAAPPAGGEVAGTPSVAAPASGTVAATGTTHSVDVGAGGLAFTPAEIQAAVGDTVVFTFKNANHTATQSAFDTPCDPLAGGMDSGFQPNANGTVNPPPQVAMQVQVTTPLWFFCRQNGHCGKGMTFSINPTAEKTQALFQANAIAQKGQGTGSTITGNGGAPAAAPPAGESASAAAPAASAPVGEAGGAASLTATLGGGAEATSTLAAGAAQSTGIVTGSGSLNPDGSCTCAVVCAAGSFPSSQQGVNNFGGLAGAIPASMAMVV